MKYSFKKVYPCYSGGGIYLFVGQLADDTSFVADGLGFDTRLLDTNVFKVDWDNELWDADWQESHKVADLDDTKSLEFFEDMLKWIIANKPEGNYNTHDMKNLLGVARDILFDPIKWR